MSKQKIHSGWKTTLLTSIFFYGHPFLVLWYYADGIVTDVRIRMFADVRWVGFLPPFCPGRNGREKQFCNICHCTSRRLSQSRKSSPWTATTRTPNQAFNFDFFTAHEIRRLSRGHFLSYL